MSRPKPKPIRLTRKRALALLEVFEHGATQWETALTLALPRATDAEQMERLRATDHTLAAARDAAAIVRHRYLGGDVPEQPTPTLFD